ncbi:MAG TPA: STAS domain-containing protein [Spirochaetales bacterium]|nr:STAS domain-containing protein [Spirochaetales bacterium]HRY53397.1 STAS domain-containing protein [Spirochaetia bacterium]HRZ63972.1 STAS domain-containing protein [Spirochaetia bacterium]
MEAEAIVAHHNARHPETRVEVRGVAGAPGSAFVLRLFGDLDMKRSTDLGPVLEAVLAACPRGSSLYLDLAGVSYISSTGIGLVTALLTRGQERGVGLTLVRVPQKMSVILSTLGLLSFFRVEQEAPQTEGEP